MVSVLWRPAWYELDQSIKCGKKGEYWLVKDSINPMRFHTGLDNKEYLVTVYGEIVSIKHKHLGDINEIDTNGLSYKIYLATDHVIQVEAEENPGYIEKEFSTYKVDFNTDDFCFEVLIRED